MSTPIRDLRVWSAGEVGFYFAVASIVFVGILDVTNRWALTSLNINIWGLMITQLIAGGVAMLAVAGVGQSGMATLRHWPTWTLGLFRAGNLVAYFYALALITATEFSLLTKIMTPMGILMAWFIFKRIPARNEWPGISLIMLGWLGLLATQDGGVWAVIAVLIAAFFTVLESMTIESHPHLYEKVTTKGQLRFTGIVLVSTGIIFVGIAALFRGVEALNFVHLSFIPSTFNLFSTHTLMYGILSGILLRSPFVFFAVQAIRKSKTEMYLAANVLAPYITLGFESIAGLFGIVDTSTIGAGDVALSIVISAGALWLIIVKIQAEHAAIEADAIEGHPVFGRNPFYQHPDKK